MKVKVEVINSLHTPSYAKDQDAGADIRTAERIRIPYGGTRKIKLGCKVDIPNGYFGLIVPRSGYTIKHGLIVHPVPIDPSYKGPIHAIVTNTQEIAFIIETGIRIAQLVIMPFVRADFVTEIEERGDAGFGSTGEH